MALDVRRRVPLGQPERLRLPQDVLVAVALFLHAGQDEVGRPVDDAHDAHDLLAGQGLAEGVSPNAVNPLFGRTFGTFYDLITILVLCLAGASVTLVMQSLLPQFLLRFGMELRWAHAVGAIFYLFMLINMVVTVKGVTFPQQGIYLVELLLDNQWVADTTVELK